ncbi:MAG: hypothetical protein AAF629_18935 [Chloroflexota bacterium]
MNMGPTSDYRFGQLRHQDLEAELPRHIAQTESLGQVRAQLLSKFSTVNLSTIFGFGGVIVAIVLGVDIIHS